MFSRITQRLFSLKPKTIITTGFLTATSVKSYLYFTSDKARIYTEIASGLPLTEESLKKLQELKENQKRLTFLKYSPLEAALSLNNKEVVKQLLSTYEMTQFAKEIAIMNMNSDILEEIFKYYPEISTWKVGEIPVLKYYQDKNPVMEKWLTEKIQKIFITFKLILTSNFF